MANALNDLLGPIQAAYQASKEWQEIAAKAYPEPPKKEKKVKNKGTGYPGNKKQEQETSLPIRTKEDAQKAQMAEKRDS